MLRKFIVERDISGLGELTPAELGYVAREANAALALIPGIQWQHSYVTADKSYCVFMAESEELVREHALMARLPTARITEVKDVIDPATGVFARDEVGLSSRDAVEGWFARRRGVASA